MLSLLRSDSAAGLLVRRLLPVTLGAPLVLGVLRLAGQRVGLYSTATGVAIMAASAIVGATALLLRTAGSVERSDRAQRRAEAALRRSRAQYQALARNFPGGAVVLFDRDLRFLIADGTAMAAVGLSSSVIEGRTIWQAFPAEVCAAIEPPYRAALAGAESAFEYWYDERCYLVRVVPVRDERTGEIWAGAATAQDVSERKREEAQLREAGERFAGIFANAPIGEAIVALDGRWLEVNRSLCELVGYSESELLAKTVDELTHPLDLDSDLELARRLLDGEIRSYRLEKRYLHRHGYAVWAQVSVSLVRSADGEPLYFVSQVEDITARREAEDALRTSEARLAEAEKLAALGSWEWRLDGDELSWSDELYRIRGLPVGSPLSRDSLLRDILPEDRPRMEEATRRTLESGEPMLVDYRVRRRDGSIRWLQGRGNVVRGANGPLRMHGTVQDITDRKEAEAERDRLEQDLRHAQKLEATGRLAAGVAHEFNNMLMAISGHGELLRRRLPEGSPARHDVEQIRGAAGRAAALTGQLLAFGRRQILRPAPVDLNDVVENAVNLLRPLIDARIDVVKKLPRALPCANADPAQLEQVLVNLVLNARDAIDGSGTITIATAAAAVDAAAARRERVRPGPFLQLRVTDTGSGMDEATRGRIFEPFFTTKAAGRGTGLGLSTCYGIVRQGGGFLTVASEPRRGTSITAWVPAAADAAGAHGVARPPASAGRAPSRRRAALVVDDDAAVRAVCAELLEQLDYRVETARDGDETLDILARATEPPHVVLTDLRMPGMSGSELAARIASAYPATAVVCMSGYPGDRNGEDGRSSFLQKPFAAAELEAAIADRTRSGPGDAAAARFGCVVADDHPFVLDAICRMLDDDGIDVAARASDADGAVREIARHRPKVALLDVAMPGPGPLETLRRARRRSPATRLILYTGDAGQSLAAAALAAGARGVVLKSTPLDELSRAIDLVADGEIYLDSTLADDASAEPPEPPHGGATPLTGREHDVLRLVAGGQTNEQVARTLSISAETVQTHVRNAMKKLGAGTRTHAVATAMRRSLIG